MRPCWRFFIFSHVVETYNNNSLHHGLAFFSLFCHNLQAAEVVNCKIKVVYVDIQTVLDRLARPIYPLVAYLYLQSIFVKNYESWLPWLAVDIVIAIITAYCFSGPHCIFILQFTDLKK